MEAYAITAKYKSDEQYKEATQIVASLRRAGFKAFFVGGCVRDLLLQTRPKDYDIATDAKPEEVKEIFPNAFGFGKRFGVSIVPVNQHEFEVAAFREDGFYYDHRRPAWVNYGDISEDAMRRDFTVNALYYDPILDDVIDLVGGRADLQKRVLRIIGDPFERFDEDWLRILRAIRFAARFALKFDYQTWDALRTLAPMITGIAAERRTEELRLMLTGAHSGRAIGLLYSSGLWRTMWPEWSFKPARIRKAIERLKKEKAKTGVWASLLIDLPEEKKAGICRELRLTRPEMKAIGMKHHEHRKS